MYYSFGSGTMVLWHYRTKQFIVGHSELAGLVCRVDTGAWCLVPELACSSLPGSYSSVLSALPGPARPWRGGRTPGPSSATRPMAARSGSRARRSWCGTAALGRRRPARRAGHPSPSPTTTSLRWEYDAVYCWIVVHYSTAQYIHIKCPFHCSTVLLI